MLSSFAASTVKPATRASAGKRNGDVADHVLDEHRVVVGLHRDVALVGPLEQRVDGAEADCFGDVDQFLDPDQLRARRPRSAATLRS